MEGRAEAGEDEEAEAVAEGDVLEEKFMGDEKAVAGFMLQQAVDREQK